MGNFEPLNKNLLEYNFLGEEYSNIVFSGRRKECKSKGLKGKEFRDCLKELRKEDKGKSRSERKILSKKRKEEFKVALSEGKVPKGEVGRKAVHSIMKFTPATLAMRGAVLSLLNMNVVDIAHAFSLIKDENGTHWKQIQQKWWQWGGDKSKLDKAVEKGKNKKPLFKDLIEKFQRKRNKKNGIDGDYSNAGGDGKGLNTAGNVVAGSAALMGTAAGILALIPETATTKAAAGWLGVGAGAFGAMSPILKSFAKEKMASAEKLAAIPPVPTGEKNPDNIPVVAPTDARMIAKIADDIDKGDDSKDIDKGEGDDKILGINKTLFWSGAVLLGLGLALIIYKKQKGKGVPSA